jgi:preprotein translocase subunit SecE
VAAVKTNKNAKTSKKDVKKGAEKKRNLIRYIKDVIQELKKVTWPTRKELINAVIAVVVFVTLFTLIIWLIDLGLTPAFQWLIGS